MTVGLSSLKMMPIHTLSIGLCFRFEESSSPTIPSFVNVSNLESCCFFIPR